MKKRIKRKYYYFITICLILFLLLIFIIIYNKQIYPKINIIVSEKITNKIYNNINKTISNINTDELLKIYKNNEGEILYLDFDLNKSYIILNEITEKIKNNFSSLIIEVPFFIKNNNIFISSLGPKIKLKVLYDNLLITNIYTKVTDYGLNNALIEAYIKIEISNLIIAPITSKKEIFSYDFLIASKVISGRVPNLITSNSNLLDVNNE